MAYLKGFWCLDLVPAKYFYKFLNEKYKNMVNLARDISIDI